eukprot:661902-Ditylum_brightwellii.AAC.1
MSWTPSLVSKSPAYSLSGPGAKGVSNAWCRCKMFCSSNLLITSSLFTIGSHGSWKASEEIADEYIV